MGVIITILMWLLRILLGLLVAFLAIWGYAFLVRSEKLPHFMRYWPVRILAPLANFVIGADIVVHGKENIPEFKGKKGYQIVANHGSMVDILALAVAMKDPIAFIAKKEIGKVPFLGVWAVTLCCPLIDRDNLRQSYSAVMVEGSKNIQKGIAMAIFPSGTRSKSNEVLDFKAGSFKMGTSIQAPILPVAIADAYKTANANIFKRVKVHVFVLPIIEPEAYAEMSSFALAKHTQNLITETIENFEKERNNHE